MEPQFRQLSINFINFITSFISSLYCYNNIIRKHGGNSVKDLIPFDSGNFINQTKFLWFELIQFRIKLRIKLTELKPPVFMNAMNNLVLVF